VALCPNEVVFRARASQSITDDPFITFTWDSADIGGYADVWEGMVVYLSATTDIRAAKYRGRVRLAPSSSVFYIDLNATILNDNDYIIVVRDCDLFARIRTDTLVDGSIAYTALPPMTKGLPNTVVLYDADNDGSVTYTTVQAGIPVDPDAATVDTWAWAVSGNGASSIDDDTAQNPTLTFEAGYHYLVRVAYADDSGTPNYQLMHVYAVTRTFDAPVVQPVIAGSVTGNMEDGWTADLTAYADVSALIDRTHAVVFHVEHFGDGSSTPIFDNVLMNGRIRSDSIQTQGSAEAGVLQQVTFTVEGITAYLRRLRIPNDIVRSVASPSAWGEGIEWNPYRMAVYAMWVYSTLTNIGSFGVEEGEFTDYQIGGEPRGIDGGSALEVLKSLLDPIRAASNYAPSGELFLARGVDYRADRSGVPLIAVFGLKDMTEYNVERDSSRTYAQVIAYGGVYNSTADTWVLYTASAPSIVYGDGGDTLEITREILTADSTPEGAAQELGERASNHYAHENPKPLLSETLFDSYAGVMIPTNYQRWASVLPASSNTLGVPYTATDYWLLQSVTLTLNTDGTIDVAVDKPAETSFDDAQIIADQLPNALEGMNPVLPVLPNDPAFPTDALELYPTDTPDLEDLQPINPDSAAQAYTPFPPDVAAEMAARQGTANCKTLAVNFRWASNVTSSWTTVLNDPYLMTIEGFARVSNNGWIHTVNFAGGLEGFILDAAFGAWAAGVGITPTNGGVPPTFTAAIRSLLAADNIASTTFTSVNIVFDFTKGTYTAVTPAALIFFNSGQIATISSSVITTGTNKTLSWTGSAAGVTQVAVQLVMSYDGAGPHVYSGDGVLKSITMTGVGTNPFTGATGSTIETDGLYQWQRDDDGNEINVSLLPGGLYLDNVKYTPVPTAPFPPFSKNHRYADLPYTGTNNPLQARMVLDNTNAQNVYLNITMCRRT
jgi:hypothetical protein